MADVIAVSILVILVAASLHLLFQAVRHRQRAKQAGRAVGSLWHHATQWSKEHEATTKQLKAVDKSGVGAREKAAVMRLGALGRSTPETIEPLDLDSLPCKVRFAYVDADGAMTTRTVTVHSAWDERFEGECSLRGAERTFRYDGIVGDVINLETGECVAPELWRASLSV